MGAYQRFSLEGRTVFVAGASRGIGLAIAQEAAAAGARTVMGSRSVEPLQAEADRLVTQGLTAEAVELDVTDATATAEVVASLPDLDGLVFVAGTNVRKAFETYSEEEYARIVDTNLHAGTRLARLVGAAMLRRGRGGKIVFIGSSNQVTSLPYLAPYAMTKAALGGLTRALAAEWGRHEIQVNCIAPGLIWTDLTARMLSDPDIAAWREGVQPIQRWGQPADIGPLAVYLLGPASDFVTGQTIAVDGGYTTTKVWPFRPAEDDAGRTTTGDR